ncbi:MAG: tRNA (guanosine(46)-N7)-methyltransferase TrmB [Alphaproteobacteria bacterium]
MTDNHKNYIRHVHGRRIGRPLNALRKSVLEELLPVLSIPAAALSEKADLDPAQLFAQKYNECWMEIGFGNGEHLAALTRVHPDKSFLGAEPFINGMAAFLKDISCHPGGSRDRGAIKKPDPVLQRNDILKNVRVLMDDAMKIIHSLKNESLDRLYILNPDPWPKKRHRKRRIVSAENLDAFARVLKPGALLIMATDVEALAEWMTEQMDNHPRFEWDAENKADLHKMPKDWLLTTRYAQKGLDAGRRETYLLFSKSH